MSAEGPFGQFHDPDRAFSVVFEDDGRVAYGYLLDSAQNVLADVWLYNRCEAPSSPEWDDPSRMPFANPSEFVRRDQDFAPVADISEVDVTWDHDDPSRISAQIFIRGRRFAVLRPGDRPGTCILAAKDGPLAKTL